MPERLKYIFTILSALLLTIFAASFAETTAVYAGTTAPVTTLVQTPSSPNGNNSWYITPVQFDLTATDVESGVREINYRVDGGTWQTVSFSDSLNLAPNPSFENAGAESSGNEDWEATVLDGSGSYAHDIGEAYPGFGSASARIIATDGTWHAINNQAEFAVATPFGNMSASAWIKTDSVTGTASFDVYSVSQDGTGPISYVLVSSSSTTLTGTNDWTQLKSNFVVNDANSIGVYLDIGLNSAGTIWVDAVSLSESLTTANTSVTVSDDSETHTFEYYSVDNAGNTEAYACPSTNCVEFKIDQTAPGGWYDSGAYRGFLGPSYWVWTYTNVRDETSGISVFSDKFQIKTELEPEFGKYSNIFSCSSTWQPNAWLFLITPPFTPGANDVFMLAPKTSFCNDNWNQCKLVKFYAQDMAGNSSTKDFCVNGPWIRATGEGIVRANYDIDMLAEADGDNTDGLIEAGGNFIDFFDSSRGWEVLSSSEPITYNYNEYWSRATSVKSEITDGNLVSDTDIYYVDGDLVIDSGNIPSDYDTATFDQVVFVNGNLTINADIDISDNSSVLFINNGDVNISKDVQLVDAAIFSDGDVYTAFDISDGDSTEILTLRGTFSADEFILQRTLVGTSNSNTPSEDFIYEPKYSIQQRDFFGVNEITWKNID